MSVQINIMEMLDVLRELNHQDAAELQSRAEALATKMAQVIAQELDCTTDEATHQGMAFAGLCAPFRPKRRDQEFPAALSQFDDGGEEEWQEDCEDLCTECDADNTGGDGYDGKCGNCADKDAIDD